MRCFDSGPISNDNEQAYTIHLATDGFDKAEYTKAGIEYPSLGCDFLLDGQKRADYSMALDRGLVFAILEEAWVSEDRKAPMLFAAPVSRFI